MEIIPVLDLMNGVAVHARQGRREQYRPLQSPLCESSEPQAVLAGLLGLHPFKTVYIADLDALMGGCRQTTTLERLRRAFPEVIFWIDQGWPDQGNRGFFGPEENALTVIGSESLTEERLPMLAHEGGPFLLSLDFREGELLGPRSLLNRPELWPKGVILMNLSRLGGTEGPDFARAEQFRRGYPGHQFIAAGGVRDGNDLQRLEALGLAGVLVASALHAGTVDSRALRPFGQET